MNRELFAEGLRGLGVVAGDTLYIRASLGALGRLRGDIFDTVIGGLADAVGPAGTLMAPAFTKIGNVFSKARPVFDARAVPYSGAVSKLFLKHPAALRSSHPSHSFVAFGPRAAELIKDHDKNASAFLPVKKLAEQEGKMLLLGCNNDSPGFSTVHVAQFDLGLSQGHLVRHLMRGWIREGDQLVEWKPNESPGCSLSFDKFYPAYMRDENLRTGWIGSAYALLVPSTRKALERDREILKAQPTFVDCGRASCLTCGLRTYQAWRIPRTVVAAGFKYLKPR